MPSALCDLRRLYGSCPLGGRLSRARMKRMPHVIEAAATGRAKCRGCGGKIAALELRFGERLPNPFADGEMTHWFHLDCAAFKRPEPLLEALAERKEPLDGSDRLGGGGGAGAGAR